MSNSSVDKTTTKGDVMPKSYGDDNVMRLVMTVVVTDDDDVDVLWLEMFAFTFRDLLTEHPVTLLRQSAPFVLSPQDP